MKYFWVTVRETREQLELVEAESLKDAEDKVQEWYINDGVDMNHARIVNTSYGVRIVE